MALHLRTSSSRPSTLRPLRLNKPAPAASSLGSRRQYGINPGRSPRPQPWAAVAVAAVFIGAAAYAVLKPDGDLSGHAEGGGPKTSAKPPTQGHVQTDGPGKGGKGTPENENASSKEKFQESVSKTRSGPPETKVNAGGGGHPKAT